MKCPALRFAVAALLLTGSLATVAADSYWYIGLGTGLGYAQLYTADFNTNTPGCAPPVTCTDSKQEFDVGFKGFVGYQINKNWAFEVSWTSAGKFHYKVDNGSVTQDAIYEVKGAGYSFVPMIPLSRKLSLYGRLGGFASQTRLTVHNQDFSVGNSSSGLQSNQFSPLIGFGAQYFFDEGSGIRIEFENYGQVGSACSSNSTSCTGRADVSMLSANLIFPF